MGRAATYQNSSSYGSDGVPPLSPVHIAVAVPASDSVQETWHDSAVAGKVQTATQLVINLNQIKDYPTKCRWDGDDAPTNELPWTAKTTTTTQPYFSGDFSFAFMCHRILLFIASVLANISSKGCCCFSCYQAVGKRNSNGTDANMNSVLLCGRYRSAVVFLATTFLPVVFFCRLK